MEKIKKRKDVTAIWEQHKLSVAGYIKSKIGDEDTANGLAHEVLLKLYKACCSGREIRNTRSWILRIAHNTCMDYFKKSSKKVALKRDVAAEDDSHVYKRAGEFIEPLLQLLPHKYAVPLRMSALENRKQQQVAEELGLSLAATKSRILRGKSMLKDKMTECFQLDLNEAGGLHSFQVKHSCEPIRRQEFGGMPQYRQGEREECCSYSPV